MADELRLQLVIETKKEGQALQQVATGLKGIEQQSLTAKVGWVAFGAAVASLTIGVINAFGRMAEAAVQFVADSTEAFQNFDEGVREVATLSQEYQTDNGFAQLNEDVRNLATDTSRLTTEIIPAVYQAVSLGIDPGNVYDDILLASDAARAGTASLTETLVAGQSIVNAYGEDVITLEEVFDLMFLTVRDGATTFTELSGNLSEVTSVAGEVGVGFADISAALVVMTKQGDSTSEAVQLLSNLLVQLGVSGSAAGSAFQEAAGVSFKEFIAEGNSLADALMLLEEHADSMGQGLLDMLGGASPFFRDIQAARGAVELTGHRMEEFKEQTDEARDAVGLMSDAADVMGESTKRNADEMATAWEEVRLAAGEKFAPMMAEVSEEVVKQLGLLVDAFEASPGSIEGMFHALVDIVTVLGALARFSLWAADNFGAFLLSFEAYVDAVHDNIDFITGVTPDDYLADIFKDGTFDTASANLQQLNSDLDQFEGNLEERDARLRAFQGDILPGVQFGGTIDHLDQIIISLKTGYTPTLEEAAEIIDQIGSGTTINFKNPFGLYTAGAEQATHHTGLLKKEYDELGNAVLTTTSSFDGGIKVVPEFTDTIINQKQAFTDSLTPFEAYNRNLKDFISSAQQASVPGLLVDSFRASEDMVIELLDAQQAMAEGAEDAGDRVLAANEAIAESYRQIAFEALLAKASMGEIDIDVAFDFAVAAGIMTEVEAEAQLATAKLRTEVVLLAESYRFSTMTAEEQLDALRLLEGGYVDSAEDALRLASGNTVAAIEMGKAKNAASDLRGELLAIPNDVDVNINVSVTGDEIPNVDFSDPNQKGQPPIALATGGIVPSVRGSRPGVDSVPAVLTPGETVLPERTVDAMGGPAVVRSLISSSGATGFLDMYRSRWAMSSSSPPSATSSPTTPSVPSSSERMPGIEVHLHFGSASQQDMMDAAQQFLDIIGSSLR